MQIAKVWNVRIVKKNDDDFVEQLIWYVSYCDKLLVIAEEMSKLFLVLKK